MGLSVKPLFMAAFLVYFIFVALSLFLFSSVVCYYFLFRIWRHKLTTIYIQVQDETAKEWNISKWALVAGEAWKEQPRKVYIGI